MLRRNSRSVSGSDAVPAVPAQAQGAGEDVMHGLCSPLPFAEALSELADDLGLGDPLDCSQLTHPARRCLCDVCEGLRADEADRVEALWRGAGGID